MKGALGNRIKLFECCSQLSSQVKMFAFIDDSFVPMIKKTNGWTTPTLNIIFCPKKPTMPGELTFYQLRWIIPDAVRFLNPMVFQFGPILQRHVYWGEYPLSFAACNESEDCFKLLLARGADSNIQDTNGNAVLHMCVIMDKLVSKMAEKSAKK